VPYRLEATPERALLHMSCNRLVCDQEVHSLPGPALWPASMRHLRGL